MFKYLLVVVVCSIIVEVYSFTLQKIDNGDSPHTIEMKIEYFQRRNPSEKIQISDYEYSDINTDSSLYIEGGFAQKDEDALKSEIKDNMELRNFFMISSTQSNNTTDDTAQPTPIDSWSVVWYIASFGGLIAFFLVVSCSEWCCRRNIRERNCARNSSTPSSTPTIPDTPPPSYDHFAPPSYESISAFKRGEKSEYDVYVVPVHALGSIMESSTKDDDEPPSYFSASGNANFRLAVPPSPQSNTSSSQNELPLVHNCTLQAQSHSVT